MNVLAPEFYQLDTDESFTIRIDSEGGAYLAFGNVNNFNLPFDEGTPEAEVTPAILAGPNSVNRIHLHLVYPQDTPPQSYTVRVLDADGNEVDSVDAPLNTARQRPYRIDVDLVAQVS